MFAKLLNVLGLRPEETPTTTWCDIFGLRPGNPPTATWWTVLLRPKPHSADQVISLIRCFSPVIACLAVILVCLTWSLGGKRKRSSAPLSGDRSDRPHFQCGKEEDLGRSGKIFLSHDGGIGTEEIKKLKELSLITSKPKGEIRLITGLTKQCMEIEKGCFPDVVMGSYEKCHCDVLKKHLSKLIRVGKGYKMSKSLYTPHIESDAVDRLWESPNLFEKSLKAMIPEVPPAPPPIKGRVTIIGSIGLETDFIEEKVRNHLGRHITKRKLEQNWDLPTEIQISRDIFLPSCPKLMHSLLKSKIYAHIIIVQTEPLFISNEQKKMLEGNLMKKIIDYKYGLLPNVVQMSSINFMESYPKEDAFASLEIIKGRTMFTGNFVCYKKTIHQNQTLSLCSSSNNNEKSTELGKVVKDKLDICIRKQCKVTYHLESKRRLPKLIASDRGYGEPYYIPFNEQDLIRQLELNSKHKPIPQLCGFETLHEELSKMMISKGQYIQPYTKIVATQIVPIDLKSNYIANHTRLFLEWHIKQKKLQHYWSVPLLIFRSQQAFIPPSPKLSVSQLKPRLDFDVNIIPIELPFLRAEGKNNLELNVMKRVRQNLWSLPEVVRLPLASFIPCAPLINSVRPQLITKKYESLVNGKFKTACLPSTYVQLKGGKPTIPECEQSIKFVKSSNQRILSELKLEDKNKLDMCLIKQHLDIKLNQLPSIVQELYKHTYPPEPKKKLSNFLTAGAYSNSENAFILPASKLLFSKLCPQPNFEIKFSQSDQKFLCEEHKRRLEFSVKKKIVNNHWGLPKAVLSSSCNFMAPAPSMKDFSNECEIIKSNQIIGKTSFQKKTNKDKGMPDISLIKQNVEIHKGTLAEKVMKSYEITSKRSFQCPVWKGRIRKKLSQLYHWH